MRLGTKRGARALAVLALAAPIASIPGFANAAADQPRGESVQIHAYVPFMCLAVKGDSWADGAGIVQKHCDGAADQQFRIIDAGYDSVRITTFSGKCLDVRDNEPGINHQVVQSGCSGAPSERFALRDSGFGFVQIRAFVGGCLHVRDLPAEDSPVVQNYCFPSHNQEFKVG
jgi:Ricin-type beta-trefoil lectin domain